MNVYTYMYMYKMCIAVLIEERYQWTWGGIGGVGWVRDCENNINTVPMYKTIKKILKIILKLKVGELTSFR